VAVSVHATSSAATGSWCLALWTLALDNDANADLFGTEIVRDALVAVRPHVTTASACGAWCGAFVSLMIRTGDVLAPNVELFSVPAVRNAHATLELLASTDANAKRQWDSVSSILNDTASAHGALPSAAFDKTAPLAVALLRRGLTEQQIVQDNWAALMTLPRAAVDIILAADYALTGASVAALERHATLDVLKVKPSSPLSCALWCRVVSRFVEGPKSKRLLGTAAVRDALVAVQPRLATTADVCRWWCSAISFLANGNTANQQLLGTAAVRDALVTVSVHATTPEASHFWCSALWNVAGGNKHNVELFGTTVVRDALVTTRPHVTTADDCLMWCGALGGLLVVNARLAEHAVLFGVPAVRNAHATLAQLASTDAEAKDTCDIVGSYLEQIKQLHGA
jgi:hypothetical protein